MKFTPGADAIKKFTPGADAIKKFTPSIGIPYLGVKFGNHLSLQSVGS